MNTIDSPLSGLVQLDPPVLSSSRLLNPPAVSKAWNVSKVHAWLKTQLFVHKYDKIMT